MISFLALSTLCCVVDELNKGCQNFFFLDGVLYTFLPIKNTIHITAGKQRNHTVKCIKYQGQNKVKEWIVLLCEMSTIVCYMQNILITHICG